MNDFIKKVAYDIASYDHGYEEGYRAGLEEAANIADNIAMQSAQKMDEAVDNENLEIAHEFDERRLIAIVIARRIRNLANQAKDEKGKI